MPFHKTTCPITHLSKSFNKTRTCLKSLVSRMCASNHLKFSFEKTALAPAIIQQNRNDRYKLPMQIRRTFSCFKLLHGHWKGRRLQQNATAEIKR